MLRLSKGFVCPAINSLSNYCRQFLASGGLGCEHLGRNRRGYERISVSRTSEFLGGLDYVPATDEARERIEEAELLAETAG
jgi:hypothetical protein